MNHRLFLPCLFCLTLAAGPAVSQTRFFASGEDGHNATLQTGFSPAEVHIGGNYSHVWNGRVELGVFAGHSWLDDSSADGWFFGPGLGIGVFKPGPSFPVGLELQGLFQISTVDAGRFSEARIGYDGQIFQSDAVLYGEVALSPTLMLYPTGLVSYLRGSVEMDGNYWLGPATADVDELGLGLGLSLVAGDSFQINLQGTRVAGDITVMASVGMLKKGLAKGLHPRKETPVRDARDEGLPY